MTTATTFTTRRVYDPPSDDDGFRVLLEERLGLRIRAVVHGDRVPLAAGEVAGEIRAHHRQSDNTNVRDSLLGHEVLLVVGPRPE